MAEPKFTKGPWELWTSCSWRRFCTPYGEPIITPVVHHADKHPDLEISEANAHLIAAAPDLYEALDALYTSVRMWNEAVSAVIGRDPKMVGKNEAMDMAHKALAAARGEVQGG